MAYVVNRRGVTHSVNDDQVAALLAQGFRLATAEEIAAWYAMQGLPVPGAESSADGEDADAASEHGGADRPGAGADRRPRRR